MGQPAFLIIGFVIHLPEANMGLPGRDSGENSRQVVHGPATACEEKRDSKIRPQEPTGIISDMLCSIASRETNAGSLTGSLEVDLLVAPLD